MVFGALWLVRFAPEAAGSGIQEIEGTLEGRRAFDWRRVLPIKFFGGILALGSGMVLGREGPTVHLGGSIGKMMAEITKIPADQEDILIAAGAGAGIAVAFNAPLAGIIFVMEEIRHHFHFRVMSFRAIILACITGDIVYRLWMGQAPDIQMEHLPIPPLNSLWLFALLGIFLGVVGYFFNYFLIKILDLFGRLRSWQHLAAGAAVGGLVGLAGWQAPHFTGGGYETIAWALTTKITETTLFMVFLVRFGATLVCYGTGSPGGIFAPMLAIATVFSLWFGYYVHAWFPELVGHPQMFAVAGMAALFAASVRAPLTGIVLAVEMTMNYTLILPLLVTCLVSAMVAHRLGGQPIYAVLLQRTLDRAKREQAPRAGLPTAGNP